MPPRKRRVESQSKFGQYGLPAAGVLGGVGAGFLTHRKYAHAAYIRQLALLYSIGQFLNRPSMETKNYVEQVYKQAPLFYNNLLWPENPIGAGEFILGRLFRGELNTEDLGELVTVLSVPVNPSLFGKILTQKIF